MALWRAPLAAFLLLLGSVAAQAQDQQPQQILFIGNSFTQGANSAVLRYRPDSVTDLNDEGVGGIPALFVRFAQQAGLNWQASHELRGGSTLGFHLNEKRERIDRVWDVVVMQEYSTLDPKQPGDASGTRRDAPALGRMFAAANPGVDVYVMATWSRADQVYPATGNWHGRPVGSMALDLRAAMDIVDAESSEIDGVIPVGEAWNRAMAAGVADSNPYDGREYGKVDLWSYDHYHASAEGSYLEALVVFAQVTGLDVRQFGEGERAAHELGIEPKIAARLQAIAMEQLGR